MIDETSVVAFQACHGNNLPQHLQFIAQVILPNGKFWGVYFTGSTQAEAVGKAISCWNSEEEKRSEVVDSNGITHSAPVGRGHHLAGKVWMIHKQTREKVRIDPDQVTEYEFKGYERGGPRSK